MFLGDAGASPVQRPEAHLIDGGEREFPGQLGPHLYRCRSGVPVDVWECMTQLFLDSGELVQKFTYGEVCAGVFGFAAHEVGDLQGVPQVKVCIRMVCSVQWCMGENEATWGP